MVEEKFGTLPALAIGYHAPKRRTSDWHAVAMLDEALHGGRVGRIYRTLVLEKQIAVDAEGRLADITIQVWDWRDFRAQRKADRLPG